MKRWLPLLSLALGLAYFGSKLLPARNAGPFDLVGFGRLPVLANGRIKPMDTLARSSLLQLQHRQAVTLPDGTELAADEWLLDVFFRPDKADTYPTFVVDNPDLLSLFNLRPDDSPVRDDKRRFAYRQLEPHLSDLEEQAKLAVPWSTPPHGPRSSGPSSSSTGTSSSSAASSTRSPSPAATTSSASS